MIEAEEEDSEEESDLFRFESGYSSEGTKKWFSVGKGVPPVPKVARSTGEAEYYSQGGGCCTGGKCEHKRGKGKGNKKNKWCGEWRKIEEQIWVCPVEEGDKKGKSVRRILRITKNFPKMLKV